VENIYNNPWQYIHNNNYKILSESASFCRQYDKSILGSKVPIAVLLQNVNAKFHNVV